MPSGPSLGQFLLRVTSGSSSHASFCHIAFHHSSLSLVSHCPENPGPYSAPQSDLIPHKANIASALASHLGSALGLLLWLLARLPSSPNAQVSVREVGGLQDTCSIGLRALMFPCSWPGSLMSCHTVASLLFMHVPGAGIGEEMCLVQQGREQQTAIPLGLAATWGLLLR